MVTDALNSINSGLKAYTDMISQTENMELRNALVQMRNEAEQSQYELYQLAKSKNYYYPPAQAPENVIQNLKSVFSGTTGVSGNQSMPGSMGSSGMPGSMSSTAMPGSMTGSSMSSGMSSTGMGSMGSSMSGNMGSMVGAGKGPTK